MISHLWIPLFGAFTDNHLFSFNKYLLTDVESIANISDGLDELRATRVSLDFLSKRIYAVVDTTRRNRDISTPNGV